MGTTETEIQVHIAAPSRASDDILYRRLATAYLEFAPGRRIDLLSEPPSTAAVQQTQASSPPPPLPELVSPQLSFRSVWDNVAPVTGHGASSQQNIEKSQDSWVPPPSEVEDSMPYNDIGLADFSTPTRIMEFYLENTRTLSEISQKTQRRQDTTVYEGGEDLADLTSGVLPGQAQSQEAVDRLPTQSPRHGGNVDGTTIYEGDDNFSLLLAEAKGDGRDETCTRPALPRPDDQIIDAGLGLPPETIEVCRSTPEEQQQQQQQTETLEDPMDVTHVPQTPPSVSRKRKIANEQLPPQQEPQVESPVVSSQAGEDCDLEPYRITIPSTFAERTGSEPPPSKRLKSQPLGRSASDVLPRSSKESITSIPNSQQEAAAAAAAAEEKAKRDWRHHLEIVSPEPPTANTIAGTKPPRALEHMARLFHLTSRYKPLFPSPNRPARAMRPFARGYWLLALDDDDGWTHADKVSLWGYLGNYICRDSKAGWGTRACRDPEWRWLRLYGWEHIAGHLYMLLYTAADRRAKQVDVWWYDGAGEALMVVRARGQQDTIS